MSVLRLWVLPSHGLRTYSDVKDRLRDFLRENPETQVEVTVRTPGSLWSQLFARLKRPRETSGPHVMEIPSHWTATLAGLGLLEDLTELEPGLSLSGWHAPLQAHCRSAARGPEAGGASGAQDAPQGPAAIHSLPWWMELPILYYRPDLLRRAGLEPASLGSWSSLHDACRQLARRLPQSVYPIANSNPREAVSLYDLAPAVWSRGGDFFSRDGSRAVFHREEAFQGIRSYLELLERGWMPLLGKSGLVPPTLFEGGAALQFWGRLAGDNGRGAPPLAATASPRGERSQTGALVAHHLGLLRGAQPLRESYALLRYLSRPVQGARYAAALGALPCGSAELASALDAAGELGGVLREAMKLSRPLPNLPTLGTLERIFDRSMENLIRAILRRSYDDGLLRSELIYAASEMDYILSMAPA